MAHHSKGQEREQKKDLHVIANAYGCEPHYFNDFFYVPERVCTFTMKYLTYYDAFQMKSSDYAMR